MISGWTRRGDCWTNTDSPGIVRALSYGEYSETQRRGSSVFSGGKKNGMRLLRQVTSKLLRQEGTADTGPVLRGCPHISGSGSPAGAVQTVRQGEAGETHLAGEQSLVHEAVCLLRGKEVSCHDRQGCGERAETGLAHGQGAGEGVHAGATSAQSCGSASCNRDRRTLFAEGTYVPDRGQRFEERQTDLVWRARPVRGEH